MADLSTTALALQVLGARLKEAGAGGLRNDLNKAIHDAADPVLPQIRSQLPDYLPDRYAAVLEPDLDLRVGASAGAGRSAGARITATTRGLGGVRRRRLRRLEAGLLEHPLFGDRERWFPQTDGVAPGFFAGPIEREQPRIRQAVIDAMARVAHELTRKA